MFNKMFNTLTWQQIGLSVFILTTFVILLVLGYDLYLDLTNQKTITEYCRVNPWLAWIILGAIEFGVLGLAIHFMRPILVDKW